MSNKIYTIDEIKNKMLNTFDQCDYIDKVYLFGSYARNEANEKSDIDLVIKLKDQVGMRMYALYDKIEDILDKKSDILTEDEINNIMPKTYKKDRVLIYER